MHQLVQHDGTPNPLDAQWASVEAVTDEGERVLLFQMRRVEGGVKLDTSPPWTPPSLNPSQYFYLRQEADHLMIEGPR
jgi:hypothetical protein